MNAEQFVTDGLTAVLPPGVPLGCRVSSARFSGKQKATADVIMFDGAPGRVEVSRNPHFFNAWCIAWQDVGNWPCYWNGSAWVRDMPRQSTIFELMAGGAS